ncbi:uncharacterized protein LOC109544256 isoform X3 [Dendroctonus ponderosae]|uniref:uncharacterized protein LOC109544256 isoform X3 n=1 Tax=Dendroctonus ponderosae TaxID=77166 RepID=UPI002035FB5D|nr:uncharacterized protein LOC109544256 isoform X3 [Dendroctonus ponderosae]
MMEFSVFGSMTKLNLLGVKSNSKKAKSSNSKDATKDSAALSTDEDVRSSDRNQKSSEDSTDNKGSFIGYLGLSKWASKEHINAKPLDEGSNELVTLPETTEQLDEDEFEARDKFETTNTTFYKVLTKSFYEEHFDQLKHFRKQESGLKSSTRREKKPTRNLRERKLIISSPQNFQRLETDFTLALRKEAEKISGTLKKSASAEDLLRTSDDFSNRLLELSRGALMSGSIQNFNSAESSFHSTDKSNSSEDCKENQQRFFDECSNCGSYHNLAPKNEQSSHFNAHEVDSGSSESQNEDGEGSSNLVTMRNISQSTPELLKSINEVPKDTTSRLVENKFPYDVEIRRKPDIHINRLSKTTDFDVGRRKPISKVNPKNFEIRGLMKIQASFNVKSDLIKCKEEYIAYENENFYRINERNKNRELLYPDVLLKSVRYLKSKEVELKSTTNDTFILHFQEPKHVKIFMDNDKIQVYNIIDNKVTIKKTLLRFLGKRSSKEFLERKGIYKDEPIFGNTLREIKNRTGYLVPPFITEVIRLLEIPENIQSLGLYRTSGNLAIIQKIRFEVDNGKLSILERYSKDPDVLTGSIKLFFRELKEPLIPLDVGEKLLDIIKLSPQQFTSKEHQKIKSILVKNLDESNLETFVVIMEHLLEVVKHKEHNKMDTYNLAVCWGPSIFTLTGASIKDAIEQSKDIVSLSHNAMSLVSFFLVYYDMYPVELITLRTRVRTNSRSDNIQTLRRQASRESDSSLDSSRSQKKSSSNLSLSVDEVVKRLVDLIEPHVACGDLYVKGGSADKTNKIMKKLTKKKINELEKHKNDVYELTDALKKYLKEQDSLINEQTVEAVLKISPDTSQNCLEPTTRRKVIYLIEDTPKKDTLIFLLRHLARVIEYQERNLNVEKDELINIWSNVLNNQKKIKIPIEDFNKFLIIAILVFNDNLPDIVRSSFNSKTSNSTRSDSMDELMKEMKHQQAERDRNSRYDNVDGDAGEASILDEKTELTKL